MKKLVLFLSCVLMMACSQNNDVIKQSFDNMNEEIINLQKSVADLKLELDEVDRKNKINSDNIDSNSTAITNVKTELTYLSNASMSKSNMSDKSETPKIIDTKKPDSTDNQIIIIQDNFSDKSSLYSYAYELFKSGKYYESRKKFDEFLKLYPSDDLSDNALYWMSESYYAQREYQKSINIIEKLISTYPSGNKVPDATLKLAIDYKELGNDTKAADVLKKLIRRQPNSKASDIAKKKLTEWGVSYE